MDARRGEGDPKLCIIHDLAPVTRHRLLWHLAWEVHEWLLFSHLGPMAARKIEDVWILTDASNY